MKTALVTLTVGQKYFSRWKSVCENSWRAYAERFGFDVIALQEPLDDSKRAQSRSPAWQKCLILGTNILKRFDRIVWVDADIIINPSSPSVVADVPVDKIGATDENVFPSPDERRTIIDYFVRGFSESNPALSKYWSSFLDPSEWHALANLPKRGSHIVQTGVLVLTPRYHRDLLEHVYYSYEDAGGEPMNYEMRPLSFEIQDRGLAYWIDPRFNALLLYLRLRQQIILSANLAGIQGQMAFLREAYHSNYFLHAAGDHGWMELAAKLGRSLFDVDVDVSKIDVAIQISRNGPCPCGSGQRYKQCHGRLV